MSLIENARNIETENAINQNNWVNSIYTYVLPRTIADFDLRLHAGTSCNAFIWPHANLLHCASSRYFNPFYSYFKLFYFFKNIVYWVVKFLVVEHGEAVLCFEWKLLLDAIILKTTNGGINQVHWSLLRSMNLIKIKSLIIIIIIIIIIMIIIIIIIIIIRRRMSLYSSKYKNTYLLLQVSVRNLKR